MIEQLGLQLHLIVLWWVTGGLAVVTAVLATVGIWDARGWMRWSDSTWSFASLFTGIITLLLVGALAASLVPFNFKYWHLYSVTGTVESVTNALAEGSGDVTVRDYIVLFEGDQRPYRFSDARVTTLVDQDMEALCSIEWVYEGADKWTCEIREAEYSR